jgi:hypothetical protein
MNWQLRTKRLWIGAIALAAVAALPLAASAQTPNFSGNWMVNAEKTRAAMPVPADGPRAAAGGGGGSMGAAPGRNGGGGGGGNMMVAGGPPAPFVVAQSATELTITRQLGDATQKYVYKLGGGESVNTNARTTQTSTSSWQGAKLVTRGTTVTTTSQGDITGTFTETRWLDTAGAMHVEMTREVNGRASTTHQVLDKRG